MSVTVKAYLNFNTSAEPEIRRFCVDADASTSYDYLVEKIRNVYPGLKREDLQLFWRDEDNEYVIFSSDDELIEALTQNQEGFFRVYIKVVSKKGPNTGGEGQVHPLVTCDGCEGKVVGSRFKCSVCPDFDLCCICEAKGLHSQHHLLRIRNPGPASFIPPCPPWFMNMPWMNGRGMGPRGGWCGPRGGWGGPRRGAPAHHPFHSFGGRSGRGGGCPRFPGSGGPEQSGQSQTAGDGTAFFHQFGEALNTVLRPFGVDVHTYAENDQGKEGGCGQHEGGASSNGEGETSKNSKKDSAEPMDDASCSSPHDGDHTYVVVDDTTEDGKKTDDLLANALAHMKAMGFNDEGGWLTQLLKAKDYDLNKVLDAIQHPEKKA